MFEFSLKELEEQSQEYIPIRINDFVWEYLLYAEKMLSWETTLTYKTTYNSMREYFGNPMLNEFSTNNVYRW